VISPPSNRCGARPRSLTRRAGLLASAGGYPPLLRQSSSETQRRQRGRPLISVRSASRTAVDIGIFGRLGFVLRPAPHAEQEVSANFRSLSGEVISAVDKIRSGRVSR
jgi:hypothetical protein